MVSRQGDTGWIEVAGEEYVTVTRTRTGLRTYWLDHELVYTFPGQVADKLGYKTCDLMFVRMMLLKLRVENDTRFIIEEHSVDGAVTEFGPMHWRDACKTAQTPGFSRSL